jgi:hypothetical protein
MFLNIYNLINFMSNQEKVQSNGKLVVFENTESINLKNSFQDFKKKNNSTHNQIMFALSEQF